MLKERALGSTVCGFERKFRATCAACALASDTRQEGMTWLSRVLWASMDFALPPRCAGCGEILGGEGPFCLDCWQGLMHLTGQGCDRCNTPMDHIGLVCAPCLATPPDHDGVLAAVAYDPVPRDLVLRLKYGRKPALARVMAGLMARHAMAFPDAILVPVPLHRWRIWWRGFNQSQVIARSIANQTGQRVESDVLTRRKRTRPLGGLSKRARANEVAQAFSVRPDAKQRIAGRDVLLVDDVFTTGATSNACAKCLKRAGAASVRVLCWARVLQDES